MVLLKDFSLGSMIIKGLEIKEFKFSIVKSN